ncbi:MAG: hypothetical protein C0631_03810 [Sedimenticola sp.]|nr:MAG: hypothetical protein C0631_03810 [Sedimenticola sp.]
MAAFLKKVLVVGGVIGIGYLLGMFLVPVLTRILPADSIANIAVFDSQMLLVMSLLGFGLTVTTTRDVSLADVWVPIVTGVTSARLTLSLFVTVIGIIGLVINGDIYRWLPFLFAPVIALNVDFILYGRGRPVAAAVASFLRQSLPIVIFLLIIIVSSISEVVYALLSLGFLLLSGFYVSTTLGVRYLPVINLRDIQRYMNVLGVGVSSFVIGFQRIGFLGVVSGMLTNVESTMIYGILKVYLAFVAIRRLFIQTFYSRLNEKIIVNLSSCIILCVAVFVFIGCAFYTELIAGFMYGDITNDISHVYILLLGFLILSGSLFPCSDAILLRMKGDKAFIYVSTIAFSAFVLISSFLYIFSEHGASSFLVGLIVSELVLALGYKIAGYLINKYSVLSAIEVE